MKLAHFSDLHLCPEAGGRRQLAKTLEWVADAAQRGAKHLVFTGDLVDYANLEDVTRLYRGLARLGFDSAKDVSIVPGNHDVFPIGHHRVSVTGSAARNHASFARRTRAYLRRSERVWSNLEWPFIRRLGRNEVLVALDTVHRGFTGRLRSGVGELHEDDAAEILTHLDERYGRSTRRVLAMHHWPFRWTFPHALRRIVPWSFDCNFADLTSVRRFIRDGRFDLVLCGHMHGFEVRELGGVPVVRSSFSWHKTGSDGIEFEAGYHLIDLERLRITEHGEIAEL